MVVRPDPDGPPKERWAPPTSTRDAVAAARDATGRRTLGGPHPRPRRPGVRRGARPPAAAADLRCRARRDPARPGGGRPRMAADRRRRPRRLPHARAVSRRGRLRPRRGARADREDRAGRRANVRGGDDPQLPAGQGLPAVAPRLAGAYIGMLGPGGPDRAAPHGTRATKASTITDDDRARIHGPAGLDLGSEGPEEIAQAIVAEIVAVRRGRRGRLPEGTPRPHPRPPHTGHRGTVAQQGLDMDQPGRTVSIIGAPTSAGALWTRAGDRSCIVPRARHRRCAGSEWPAGR